MDLRQFIFEVKLAVASAKSLNQEVRDVQSNLLMLGATQEVANNLAQIIIG